MKSTLAGMTLVAIHQPWWEHQNTLAQLEREARNSITSVCSATWSDKMLSLNKETLRKNMET